jgi:flagellar protein FlaG
VKVQGTEQAIMGKVIESTGTRDVKDAKRTGINMGQRPKPEGQQQEQQERAGVDPFDAVERINKTLDALNIKLRFEMHAESGKYFVRVFNEENNETIREIPAERTLDLLVSVRRMVGALVDERV